jgi:hypothetical protein
VLAAYADNELGGAMRLRVADHLAACEDCADRLESMTSLGTMLRSAAAAVPVPVDALAGLAGGVISRTRAEEQQSWSATWSRMFEDWHWLAVGSGACSAAFCSAVLVFAMLYSPTTQARQMNERVGTLYVMTLPEHGQGEPGLLEVGSGLSDPAVDHRYAMPASFGELAERALVAQLEQSLVRRGHLVDYASLTATEREEVTSLLAEIQRFRQYAPSRRSTGVATITGVHLRIDEFVTAAGM